MTGDALLKAYEMGRYATDAIVWAAFGAGSLLAVVMLGSMFALGLFVGAQVLMHMALRGYDDAAR